MTNISDAPAKKPLRTKKPAADAAKVTGASVSDAALQAAVAKRTRTVRTFPASSFEEALNFAKSILEFGSGQPVRRVLIFDHIGKSPESGPSRQLVTNANKYNLIKGSFAAEQLELTADGKMACDDQVQPRERARARVQLAILGIEPFAALYNKFKELRLPARAALIDAVKDSGVSADACEEAVDTFIVNLRFVGLLKTLSGADRIITVEHLLDETPSNSIGASSPALIKSGSALITGQAAQFETMAFYITPIGEPGSESRKHSDLFLGSIIEPALEPLNLKVMRADKIDQPGVITNQVLEYLFKARLVIADLSFHNPNVFYELAIRHMLQKPVVQLIRAADKVPFDVNQVRSIIIDTTDIYTLTPQIDAYRSQVAAQVRRALDAPEAVDNPLTGLLSGLKAG